MVDGSSEAVFVFRSDGGNFCGLLRMVEGKVLGTKLTRMTDGLIYQCAVNTGGGNLMDGFEPGSKLIVAEVGFGFETVNDDASGLVLGGEVLIEVGGSVARGRKGNK